MIRGFYIIVNSKISHVPEAVICSCYVIVRKEFLEVPESMNRGFYRARRGNWRGTRAVAPLSLRIIEYSESGSGSFSRPCFLITRENHTAPSETAEATKA